MKELQLHYHHVQISRCLEESTRAQHPFTSPDSPLVMWIDGMDQSFWAVPRMKAGRTPKCLDGMVRPRVKVVGCWSFHLGVHFYLAHDSDPKDSSLTVELLARTIENARTVSERLNKPMPRTVLIWADNTSRENKNNCCLTYLASLIGSDQFQLAGLLSHMMGHTHSVLDQLFWCCEQILPAHPNPH